MLFVESSDSRIQGPEPNVRVYLLPLFCGLVLSVGCDRSARTVVSDLLQSAPLAPRSSPSGDGETQFSNTAAMKTLFAELPAEQTGLDFKMELYDPVEQIRALMFLTAAGGVCTGDYDDDGLADIYLTSPVGGNRLFRNLGGLKFQDVTEAAGLFRAEFWGTGATFVDIDNDGDLDIYACGYDVPNQLWINDRGVFTEKAREFGLDYNGASMTMAFADIDNDGDLDAYLATTAKQPPPGTKFGVRFEGKKPVVPEELREYWALMYLPGDRAKRTEAGQYDHLFRNDGGRFTEITKEAGIDGPYFSLSATWWDYNHDGFPDVYVSNDFLGPDMLYHNNGNGTFTNVIEDVVRHTPWFSMGSDLGDLNNDGLIDFFAADMSASNHYRDKVMMGNMDDSGWFLDLAQPRQYMRNAVYLNSGANHMMEVAFQTGLSSSDWTWSPRLEDFDNDGRVDVFATNGILRDAMNSDLSAMATKTFKDGSPEWAQFWARQPMHKEANQAFKNLGGLRFKNVAKEWGLDRVGVSFGAATADFDNDGDLDMVVNNADSAVSFYENRSTTGRRIRIKLRGTHSNRFGIGATVHVEAGGQQHARYLTLSRGWLSSCEPVLHFGLGKASRIEKLTVGWPSGHTQVFNDLPVDQDITISEPASETTNQRTAHAPQSSGPTNSMRPIFQANDNPTVAMHKENDFDDFALQPLLPNRQSQLGPALAIADIDGDGDVDGYLGGASGHAGLLLINDDSKYTSRASETFSVDSDFEDIDALFFDADADGDQDLFVVSGSNEWRPKSQQFRDRLYLNNGSGRFSKAANILPSHRDSGSCVAGGDFDDDGDVDLFIGGRAVPGSYPVAAMSRLLRNDGGKFTDATPKFFDQLGIVTDAVWTDINNDQQLDLVLTTEWGPVRCLMNQNGELVDRTVELQLGQRVGWWNAVDAGDIDGDGDIDLVITNYGHNTKYNATAEKPELMYFGDLDGTGKPHIVEAKFEDNRCLPRRGFSCSQNAMPFLLPKMQTFHNFASSTIDELYSQQRLDQCQRFQANTLTSGVLINEDNRFKFRALPPLAQIAPSMDVVLVDVDQDTHLDIVMAQNFYSPQRETGRMAGGLSLLLKGDGKGTFTPIWPRESGISLPDDTRRVVAADVNGDGRPDVIFAANDGPVNVLHNLSL